eukprot:7383804-Prymnesium_polylepis.3
MRGGAPIDMLKLELADAQLRDELFDGRAVTRWHRLADFQIVSLIQIAEGMLRCSPRYKGKELPLYLPGSLLTQKLAFPEPVMLSVSSNNPGAREAAVEVQLRFPEVGVTDATGDGAAASAPFGEAAPTHFLLYLNQQTFTEAAGETLADEVRAA